MGLRMDIYGILDNSSSYVLKIHRKTDMKSHNIFQISIIHPLKLIYIHKFFFRMTTYSQWKVFLAL